MRAGARVRSAAAAAVVGVLAVAAGGTGASAAPPDVDAVVELMPGSEDAERVVVTDDAVYFVSYSSPTLATGGTLYRRSLTATAAGHTLGTPEVIGRIVMDSSFAVHDGTVAYLRAVDGRLVLRAPDGTETVPAWGDSPAMAAGVVELSDEWLVVNDYPYDIVLTLVDRQTGAEYDLKDTVTKPPTVPWLADGWIHVTDSRALFGLFTLEYDDAAAETTFTGVYTVALGADGPVGPATVLEETVSGATGAYVGPLGFDGTRVIWTNRACDTDDCGTTARWLDAPYSGTPSNATLGDVGVLAHDGTTLVVTEDLPAAERVSWVDLGAPGTVIRSVDLPGNATIAHGSFVSYMDGPTYESYLVDASGAALTGDQTVPPPSVPFSDTRGTDLFTDEILWLYDHGVVGGYADGTFRATAPVSRGAMAAFLFRIALPGVGTVDCPAAVFDDVPADHPFCAEISWLSENSITTGYADGTFRPTAAVSREAMAAFLYRLAHDGAKAPACTAAPFTDVLVTNPFCGEIAWLADAGVSTGWPDGSFHPSTPVARQAMAAFLFRFIDAELVPPPID